MRLSKAIAFCFFLFATSPLHAQFFHPPPFISFCDPQKAIADAEQLLDGVEAKHSEKTSRYYQTFRLGNGKFEVRWAGTKKHPVHDYISREIPLVLLHMDTCELRRITVTRRIEKGAFVIEDDAPDLEVGIEDWTYGAIWNGFNTPYAITPGRWVAIGNLWRVYGSDDEYVFYAPFSRKLYVSFPSLLLAGEAHFNSDLTAAIDDLEARKVASRAFPGKLVAEVARERFVDDMSLIPQMEQADHQEFEAYRKGEIFVNPLDRAFYILGANGNDAFNGTRSKARAQGIMQIYPPTCALVRGRYPSAQIPVGCAAPLVSAMHSHIEAIKTAILLYDNNLSEVIAVLGVQALEKPDLRKWLAAMYNGGPIRLFCEILHPGTCKKRLRSETVTYLEKYEFLRTCDSGSTPESCPAR